MQVWFRPQPYVWWTLAGLSLAGAFLTTWSWPLVFPGVWFFLQAWRSSLTTRTVFFGTLLCATLKSGGATIWFWSTYPIDWIPVATGLPQLGLIGLYWSLNALVLGLGFGMVFALWRWLSGSRQWSQFLLPIVWVGGEVLGAVVHSIATYGPGSYLNANYSFGHVGYAVADSPLLDPLIRAGGVYSLCLFLVFSITATFLYVHHRQRSQLIYLGVGVGLMLVIYLTHFSLEPSAGPATELDIIAIDTAFSNPYHLSPEELKARDITLQQQVLTAIAEQPDLIVLPEGSQLSLAFGSTLETLAWLTEHASTSPVYLIDSASTPLEAGYSVMRAFIYDVGAQSVYVLDKQYLVPQGEYVPYVLRWFIPLIVPDTYAAGLFQRLNLQPGPKTSYEHIPPELPPILFCFESIAPRGVATVLQQREASVVVHPLSHAWFHDSVSHQLALERMLRVQAVWNGVTIIEAANMKPGRVYNP